MIKVKEYLDTHLFSIGESLLLTKKTGYGASGHWVYPEGYSGEPQLFNLSLEDRKKWIPPDHMSVTINNETIIVGNISVDGEWSKYHCLQTYTHIPRGEPDKNGYYARSTEEEIINYLNSFLKRIKENEYKKSIWMINNLLSKRYEK